jgi:hypothetical protein
MNSCDWVLKNEPADVCRPQGNQSGLNDIFDKELLHATLQMGSFSATEKLLNQTKYWKVGLYESGR